MGMLSQVMEGLPGVLVVTGNLALTFHGPCAAALPSAKWRKRRKVEVGKR